jgi:predicted ATP-grasp superfamily ATP-dependent carboligase
MSRPDPSLPPAILLGGGCNALSVARSLGRAGVRVYALNTPDAYVRSSRYCRPIQVTAGNDDINTWGAFLLGPESASFHGSVLLACSDAELEFLAHHREALAARYRLDLASPEAHRCVLNKLSTYRKAEAAQLALPRYWAPRTRDEVEPLRETLPYPLVVKPLYSHVYRKQFTQKLVIAHDFEAVQKAVGSARMAGLDVMLVEMVPGPDARLCSYYTYLDESGMPLFHFSKRVIRRSPPVFGGGSYHITDWIPEVKELGLRFFQAVGLRGLGNVEFKLDERDGRLKLIECNARFTEANCLVMASGLDLPLLVYNRLVGRPLPPLATYRKGVRLWYPVEDFRACVQLRRQGQLSLGQWLAGLAHRKTLPYFRWSDPWPTLVAEGRRWRQALQRRFSHRGHRELRAEKKGQSKRRE